MSGYCAVGSFVIATTPAMVVRIAMTIAMIGRRTNNAPMVLGPGFLRRRGRSGGGGGFRRHDGHSRTHSLDSLDDDLVSRLDSFVDHVHVPFRRSDLDHLHGHLVVGSDDGDLVTALELADGSL